MFADEELKEELEEIKYEISLIKTAENIEDITKILTRLHGPSCLELEVEYQKEKEAERINSNGMIAQLQYLYENQTAEVETLTDMAIELLYGNTVEELERLINE